MLRVNRPSRVFFFGLAIDYRPRDCVRPFELGHERSKSKNTDEDGKLSNHVKFADESLLHVSMKDENRYSKL